MSRGPGKIERAIVAAFEREPGNAFTVADICDRVHPGANRIEKTHRVSIGRAMRSCAAKSASYGILPSRQQGNPSIIFQRYQHRSFIMALMKADPENYYRYYKIVRGRRREVTVSPAEQETWLQGKINPDADGWKPYWVMVDAAVAQRDGDHDHLSDLRAVLEKRWFDCCGPEFEAMFGKAGDAIGEAFNRFFGWGEIIRRASRASR